MRPSFAFLALATVFLVLSAGGQAAAQSSGRRPPDGQTATSVLSAPATNDRLLAAGRAAQPPAIDGIIEDNEWLDAAIATGFIQFEPRRGAPESRRTEALLMHDDATIYIAFRVYDDESPTAQLTRRDANLLEDDSVIVILDTFFDRQSAYYFAANLLSTQADGRIANDGRTVDTNWDGTWQVATSRTDTGWSAEFAIPTTSIKYRSGEDVTWGVNFGRSRRASLELNYWTGPLDNRLRVSQAGTLSQLRIAPPPSRYQVVPYGQSVVQEGASTEWRAGVDGRYEVTSTTTTFATLNPDFALIEADQEQVNLTRFELSLPEKRQFFIEGDALFRQRIRTFYSRRISDITFGGKVLGKEGPWTFAGTYNRAEPADETTNGDYGVARLQRDLGRSNVGFMAAGRNFGGVDQGSVSIDTNLFFTDTLGITAQFAESYGEHGKGSMAYFLRPSYDSATGHFHVRYTHLGDRFRDNVNAIGFIRDDNRRELDSALEKTFWPTGGPIERIEYGSNYNVYWAANSSILRSWKIDQSVELELRNRWSGEVELSEEYKLFEKSFRNRSLGVEVGYNTREFSSVTVGYRFGRNFDADFDLYSAEAAYKVTEELSVEYELEYLTLDPDPENESTWIHVVRATQFFTPDLFIKLFLQTNSVIDRRNIQASFVYRYQPPFGTIQIAYQRGTAEFGERSDQGNTLFVKATTVF